MADTQAVSHFTPAWTLFLNSTAAEATRSVAHSTILDPSSASSPPLAVQASTSSSTPSPPAGSTSASRLFDPADPDLAITTSSPITLPEADVGAPSRLSTPLSLTVDSVANLLLTSPLISSPYSTVSSIPSLPILLSTPPLSSTNSPPSSASKQTTPPNGPAPTRDSVSQIASPPPLSPGVPTAKPEDPSPPAPTSHEEHSALPVPMITAIVVSVVVFLLLLVILLSQLRHRRQRRRGPLRIDGAVDPPGSITGRSYSLVAAYQSAHRGVVHVVVDKGARNDGIPLYHDGRPNRMSGASQRGPGTWWSSGSLGGSDTSVGAGGYPIPTDDYPGVGRAY
ncbi:hypothetical protein GGR51DRAFT_565100 [Nemania sp. FL0031]|nr:hypothetical protein GGR51DRAFT_565100 [Nemania sp. FL0031]